jgi:hypothetical protein
MPGDYGRAPGAVQHRCDRANLFAMQHKFLIMISLGSRKFAEPELHSLEPN